MQLLNNALETMFNRMWYQERYQFLSQALTPLSWVYKHLFKYYWNKPAHILSRRRNLPIPVIVVGNLVAGGSGKTPITQSLALALTQQGFKVGIVSRGYGGTTLEPTVVDIQKPHIFGDEPCLLAQTTNVPVVVGRSRLKAVEHLCRLYTLDIIVSDDGLQHAPLPRTIEIAVIGSNGLGNQRLLPAGPLREPIKRLNSIDIIIEWNKDKDNNNNHYNKKIKNNTFNTCALSINVQGERGVFETINHTPCPELNLNNLNTFIINQGICLFGLAGIAHPEQFYNTFKALNIVITPLNVSDHGCVNRHQLENLPDNALIITTEKDAIKLKYAYHPVLSDKVLQKIRVIPWRVTLPTVLLDFIINKISL